MFLVATIGEMDLAWNGVTQLLPSEHPTHADLMWLKQWEVLAGTVTLVADKECMVKNDADGAECMSVKVLLNGRVIGKLLCAVRNGLVLTFKIHALSLGYSKPSECYWDAGFRARWDKKSA